MVHEGEHDMKLIKVLSVACLIVIATWSGWALYWTWVAFEIVSGG